MSIRHIVGDCRVVLRGLPAKSVHAVATSPPYWAQRDYGNEPLLWGAADSCPHDFGFPNLEAFHRGWPAQCHGCGAWRGCLGNEPTPSMFIAHLVECFDQVFRVLRDDGLCWVNLGDTYCTDNKWGGGSSGKHADRRYARKTQRGQSGVRPKELIGIPWLFAFAMREAGWYLRQEVIWSKPNPMPESVEDRCTKSHEPIFLFTKQADAYFDYLAIQEPVSGGAHDRGTGGPGPKSQGSEERLIKANDRFYANHSDQVLTRNKRTVWTIPVARYKGAHFATFPEQLVEPCILAGTSDGGYCRCGAPWERIIETTRVPTRPGADSKVHDISGLDPENPHDEHRGMIVGNRDPLRHISMKKTIGWRPTCKCEPHDCSGRGVVLDPFGGSGTVAAVAQRLGVDAISIDLNPDYVGQQVKRNPKGVCCNE